MRPLLAVVLVIAPLAAFADEAGIHVDHVWSRAAMTGHEGVVYLTITDTGTAGHADRRHNAGRCRSRTASKH